MISARREGAPRSGPSQYRATSPHRVRQDDRPLTISGGDPLAAASLRRPAVRPPPATPTRKSYGNNMTLAPGLGNPIGRSRGCSVRLNRAGFSSAPATPPNPYSHTDTPLGVSSCRSRATTQDTQSGDTRSSVVCGVAWQPQ